MLRYTVYDGDGEMRDEDVLAAFKRDSDAIAFITSRPYDHLLLYDETNKKLEEYHEGRWREII